MTINVYYDVSMLGAYFSYKDSKMGIYRVSEEILLQLLKKQDIDITLGMLCSPNPAFSSVNCPLYIHNCLNGFTCKFDHTFQSKYKVQWLYKAIGNIYFSKRFQELPKYSLQSIPIRTVIKLIQSSGLLKHDCDQFFDSYNYDILHSTYDKLPSTELTDHLPRLLTIYDLIPVMNKDYVDPRHTHYFSQILNSINIKKDWVTCISKYTQNEFCEYTNMPIERTFVTPLAADSKFYPIQEPAIIRSINKRYNINETPYFLCLASQLNRNKNIPHLISSFIAFIIENQHLDVNLVLIGTKRYKRPDIERTVKQTIKYQDRIIFTGYVLDNDLSAIYSGAVAFIFPSLYEGFGLPVLEAMQCGTPVISSNSSSLPEVVGDAGILIDPKDEDHLCQAMLDVLTDSNLRESLRKKGLERAKQFSWKKCADQTVEIYKKIIDSK